MVMTGAVWRRAEDVVGPRSQRSLKRGSKRTVALIVKKTAPDRGHDTKYPGVVKYVDGRSRDTDANGRMHDAVSKTLRCD